LAAAGLSPKDIQIVYLPPAEGRAAFERGAVDAWAIWDPFLADAQRAIEARPLTDGSRLVANHQFYLANRSYAKTNPAVIQAVLAEIDEVSGWARRDPRAAAQLLAPLTGIDAASLEISIGRMGLGAKPMDAATAEAQQRIADAFFELGLIPRKIDVREALPSSGS
jgi:sulfonate transport system substrate-binding protein